MIIGSFPKNTVCIFAELFIVPMKFIKTGIKSSLKDEELIINFRSSGSRENLDILFDRYVHLIFGVCMKYLQDEEKSKDATMEIFGKLPEDLRKHKISYFKSWLYMVAKNNCLMQIRQSQSINKKMKGMTEEEPYFMEFEEDKHQERMTDEQLKHLPEAIESLIEEQKICIRKFYLENKSYTELSAETGFSFKQVKSFIQNGKRNLKIALSKHNEKRSAI